VATDFTGQMLKRKYSTSEKVENASVVHTRFLKDVKRLTDPGGESFNSFLIISGGVGWSGTRAGAQAVADQGGSRGNGAFQQIRNSYGKIAGEVTIREFAIKQAESGSASALRAISSHVDNHLDQWGQTAEWMLTGHRGLFVCKGTIDGSGVVTLTSSPEHITRIRPDMILVASASNGTTGSLLGSGSLGYVRSVARSGAAPTFSVSTTSGGNAATPSGWTGDIYYFLVDTWFGGTGGGGTDGGVNEGFLIDTLDSWVPETAPDSTPFKTMNRAFDEVLSGVRLGSTEVQSLNIAQRLELLAVTGRSRFGWNDDGSFKCYLHTTQFNKLNQLLQRQDMRQAGFSGKLEKASWGYNVIQMTSIGANVEVVDMPLMDPNNAWMTDPKSWLLHSSAGWPSVMDDDGLRLVRKQSLDAYSLQYTGYGSFRTEDPSKTGRVPLD
jgi:hypothetical protein